MKKKKTALILILLSSLLICAYKKNQINYYSSYISTPFLYASFYLTKPCTIIAKYCTTLRTLQKTNEALQIKLEEIKQENIALYTSFHYMQRRRDLDEFKERYALKNTYICKILLKHIGPEEQFYYINHGSKHGIKTNMVATYKFQLLGKITTVFPWYSKVQLITDPRSTVAAYTNNKRSSGIVLGKGIADSCFMQYIDPHTPLECDELIFSSGQGLLFPEGFALGSIQQIEKQDAYQNCYIKPLVDIKKLEFCSVFGAEDVPTF